MENLYHVEHLKKQRIKMAAGLGFEPRFQGPEPCVLPLDDPAEFYLQKL